MKLFKQKNEPLTAEDLAKLSPERVRIAKVLKKHIDSAVLELGAGYTVDVQGSFASTPLRIVVEVKAVDNEEIP
jgi:hypothetical protein